MRFMAIAALVAASMLSGPASAHHSANAVYDLSKTYEAEGTLVEFKNINPHAAFLFDIKGPDGKVTRWRLMSAAPAFWARSGVKVKDDFKPGHVFKLKYAPGMQPGVPAGIVRAIEVNGKWVVASLA